MPDVDEHQRLLLDTKKYSFQQQQSLKMINTLIPDIWSDIGKSRGPLIDRFLLD